MSNTYTTHTTATVQSKDGTVISYRQLGTGPGLILVHGGLMAAQNMQKLAEQLAANYTVYIPDRRGRGKSGLPGNNYSLAKEAEDIAALATVTGSQYLFGLSSGAIISLAVIATITTIRKTALYEPPIPVNDNKQPAWVQQYEHALNAGNNGAALNAIVKGAGDTSLLQYLPDFITIPMLNAALRSDERKANGHNIAINTLLPTMKLDIALVEESPALLETNNYNGMLLLMGGAKSQAYLKAAIDKLSVMLPGAQRITLQGVGHLAADNTGKPQLVAAELRRFFQ